MWRFIHIHAYERPAEPTVDRVRLDIKNAWLSTRRWFTQNVLRSDEEPVMEVAAPPLRHIPHDWFEWLAPQPRWRSQYGNALNRHLKPWLEGAKEQAAVQTFTDLPYAHLKGGLIAWGKKHDLKLIKLPTAHEVLAGGESWFEDWFGSEQLETDQPFLLPALEKCFLRHHNGLALIRRLLDHIVQTKRRGVIFCDSWAWAYLCNVIKIDAFLDEAWTPAPFGKEQLTQWLMALYTRSEPSRFIFRQADDGRPVIVAHDSPLEDVEAMHQEAEQSNFLAWIATHSQGNVGVAWALWQRSMRIADNEMVKEKALEEAASDIGTTVWLTPWEQLDLPTVPTTPTTAESFVLHSIAVHGGLAPSLLTELLPLPPSTVMQIVRRFEQRGVLEQRNGIWNITILAYPRVHELLKREGYFIDAL